MSKAQDNDDAVRAAVEQSMPGWEAVPEQDACGASAERPADFVGKDIAALKAKYPGAAADAAPSRYSNEDAKFVALRPKNVEGPVRTRKAIVSGKRVVGFQG